MWSWDCYSDWTGCNKGGKEGDEECLEEMHFDDGIGLMMSMSDEECDGTDDELIEFDRRPSPLYAFASMISRLTHAALLAHRGYC